MVTKKYFITVATVVLGGSAQFYSYGVVNPAQVIITDWINQTYIERYKTPLSLTVSNVIWSFVVSSIAIGAILGASFTRIIGEKYGRRNGLIFNGILNVFAALFELVAKKFSSPEILIFGRFIYGINMGLSSGLVPMYLMEITPYKFRGPAGTLHQVAVAFSDWFSLLIGLPEVLGDANNWPLAFALPGLPALALVCILPFCPESPKYTLGTKHDREKALRDVEKLIGKDHAPHMFESIVREVALDEGDGTFKELFTRRDLRVPLAVSIIVMIAQQFTGCTAVFAYSTDMFLNAGLSPLLARFSTLAIGIVYFLFACTSPFLIHKVGRRSLSLFQLASCMVALMMLSLFTFLQTYENIEWARYGTIFSLVFYMCVYGVGSPIPWIIASELFTQQFRATAVTVSVFVAWTFAFLVSTSYLPFQQLVGVTLSYFPFIIGLAVFGIFIYVLLPETRDRPMVEIVTEVHHRTASLSAGRPWDASRPPSRQEVQRLLDTMDPRSYSSYDNDAANEE
ncbi:Protein CBG08087 [Caenorhabditis briggsae]|uniref:Major facilitator superfamily (MFS) profile domain-containing protein n=2 Tax=Caenorhabditis briggsae TaxID=6238 RepID=A0AAE9JPQ7_CAEBR|nr:Protein CBG08087 [Caenorhabditis briggsae]ULT79513.1 hypothetical protein L3Y34_010247 [Caenorhabditis briggsae]UMM38816.1 hypothetical protein L5515_016137 [Caenorhabditis briggsae]CAP27983.2 Protein CBG08087 [Caenorhabditis briggsae]